MKHALPPEYQRNKSPAHPKLHAFIPIMGQLLEEDKARIKKQRHAAKRLHSRLRDEQRFTGGITIVNDGVREKKRRSQEIFPPLSHLPGHAQVVFGEALGVIGGVERNLRYFTLALPHSDAIFIKVCSAETTEAFCDGHNATFKFFARIALSILYDNMTVAVVKISGPSQRFAAQTPAGQGMASERAWAFAELQSHYLFEDKFGRPAKGDEKGHVEGAVGYGC